MPVERALPWPRDEADRDLTPGPQSERPGLSISASSIQASFERVERVIGKLRTCSADELLVEGEAKLSRRGLARSDRAFSPQPAFASEIRRGRNTPTLCYPNPTFRARGRARARGRF
jgi:hypothetical protein